eukprot:311588_1
MNAHESTLSDTNNIECISEMESSIFMTSTTFTNNHVSNILDVYNSPTYIDDNTIISDNVCQQYCIESTETSLSIGGNNLNSTDKFLQFGHENGNINATHNISLCVRNRENIKFAKRIVFQNANKTNTKIVFGDILPIFIEPNELPQFDQVFETIDCNNTTSSCNKDPIIVNKSTNIYCKTSNSCAYGVITIPINSGNNISLHIICEQSSSCTSLKIDIIQNNEFILDCYATDSCTEVIINILSSNSSKIFCHQTESCDSIQVITYKYDTNIIMYKFSKNVTIHNPGGYTTENLHCGYEDQYVYLNFQHKKITESIFPSYYPLPCSDVTFMCQESNSCSITQIIQQTNLNFVYDFFQYGPIYLKDVINNNCIGSCANSPTSYPTFKPSMTPTISPTECIIYHINDSISDKKTSISHLNLKNISTEYKNTYVASLELQTNFYGQNIYCNDTNITNTCFVGCYYAGSCTDLKINPTKLESMEILQVDCRHLYSCVNIQVNITSTSIKELHILCLDKFSCDGIQVFVHVKLSVNITVECQSSFSCNDAILDLSVAKKKHIQVTVNILCDIDNACDNMFIVTDDSKNIFIELHIKQYSKDITIDHQFYNNIEIICGSLQDEKLIKYSTSELLDASEILNLARDEYDNNRLPCEDIIIDCSGNVTNFYQSCEYKYQLSNEVNLLNILSDDNVPNCYWMDIADTKIMVPECKGSCADKIEYTQYNITFPLNMWLIDDKDQNKYNHSNLTQSFVVCDEYFGLVNDTIDSLSSIDAIFYYVLQLLSEINDIIIPP